MWDSSGFHRDVSSATAAATTTTTAAPTAAALQGSLPLPAASRPSQHTRLQ